MHIWKHICTKRRRSRKKKSLQTKVIGCPTFTTRMLKEMLRLGAPPDRENIP